MIIERDGIQANIVNPTWVVLRINAQPKPLVFFATNYFEAKAKWEAYALRHVHLSSLANRGRR